ncbi:MAG TPA: PrsW family glutamic-type intramembrane protease [Gemmatimonadaceae bacterium]|nr:PrsW family glutamic-type intramembrane protease [Gemmatimonadaceae bacterium]
MMERGTQPTISELFPLRARWVRAAHRKAYLIPALVAVLVAVALAVAAGGDQVYWLRVGDGTAYPIPAFNLILGPAAAAAFVYAIYRLAGKPVSPWLLLLPAAVELVLLQPNVFAVLRLPFAAIATGAADPRVDDFQRWSLHVLVSVAPLEELVKAAPIFLAWWWNAQRAHVREPLDGILIGVASGAAFACFETIVLYIGGLSALRMPMTRALFDAMRSVAAQHLSTGGTDPQAWLGQFMVALHGQTEILVARLANQMAGHMAWTGVFGYYIGLAALRPWGRLKSVMTGFGIAVALHWAWDTAFHRDVDRVITLLMASTTAVISWVALVTAVLKARQISPTRALNFATTGRAKPRASDGSTMRLVLAASQWRLAPGAELGEGDIVGLVSAKPDGAIARVEPHPDDANALGLHNLSTMAWTASYADGEKCVVGQGARVRLDHDLTIDFGRSRGRVELPTVSRIWGDKT